MFNHFLMANSFVFAGVIQFLAGETMSTAIKYQFSMEFTSKCLAIFRWPGTPHARRIEPGAFSKVPSLRRLDLARNQVEGMLSVAAATGDAWGWGTHGNTGVEIMGF